MLRLQGRLTSVLLFGADDHAMCCFQAIIEAMAGYVFVFEYGLVAATIGGQEL